MRSVYAVGLVVIAALALVFCDDDDDSDGVGNKSGSTPEYALKISGIGAAITAGTEVKVTAKITQDGKAVTEGNVTTTEVSLHIKCGNNEVAKQENKSAAAGKVQFDAIKVEGDNFTGDCTLTVSAEINKKDISAEQKFKIVDEAVITLPDPSTSGKLPTTPDTAIVGMPFIIPSTADILKIQPNELCKGALVLVYYDAINKTVREVLTAGEAVKPVKGIVSGLAVVKAQADVDLGNACKKGDTSSIVLAISPGFPTGLRLKIAEASDAPSLDASLAAAENGIEMSWATATGFDGGADIFFNNKAEGNEWTHYSGTPNWAASGGDAYSSLAYVLPVKALVKVKPHGERKVPHWLYFMKDN